MSFFVQPQSKDYVCSRNGVWRVSGIFADADGNPRSLVGWNLVMQLRRAPDNTPTDPAPLLTINSSGLTANGSGILIPIPSNGGFTRYISNDDLLTLPVNPRSNQSILFAYDLVFHEPSPGTDFCPVLQGAFQVDPGVTY